MTFSRCELTLRTEVLTSSLFHKLSDFLSKCKDFLTRADEVSQIKLFDAPYRAETGGNTGPVIRPHLQLKPVSWAAPEGACWGGPRTTSACPSDREERPSSRWMTATGRCFPDWTAGLWGRAQRERIVSAPLAESRPANKNASDGWGAGVRRWPFLFLLILFNLNIFYQQRSTKLIRNMRLFYSDFLTPLKLWSQRLLIFLA